MNRNNRTLVVTLLVMLMSMTAAAQARLGVRAGLSLGHLRFDRDVVNSDNRVGYCGGLTSVSISATLSTYRSMHDTAWKSWACRMCLRP